MTQQHVYLVDLQVLYSSDPYAKIRSLSEQNVGCNSNIDSDFEREEAGRERNI